MKRLTVLVLLLIAGLGFPGCKKKQNNKGKKNAKSKLRKVAKRAMKRRAKARKVVIKRIPSVKGATVSILEPKDGAIVKGTFTVKFGIKGMAIAPAGTNKPGTGHHHLLVDTTKMPDMGMPLPMSKQLIHFGKGQTETKLTLKPGKHTLQLLLADYRHVPHTPAVMSKKITVTVK